MIFHTVFEQYYDRNGEVCELIHSITVPDDEHDEECLPMHVIRFADGEEIEAFDDELMR